MILERTTFNLIAIVLFIYIFTKMIKKDNIKLLVPLSMQTFGITVNILELINNVFVNYPFKILTYTFSIIIPIIAIALQKNDIHLLEFILLYLGKAFLKLKRYKYATKILSRLVIIYPNSYKGHENLAIVCEETGAIRKAIDEYVKIVDIRKHDIYAYYKIGELLNVLDKKEEAITILNNLLRKKSDYTNASILLGEILSDLERKQEETTVYLDALRYDPENKILNEKLEEITKRRIDLNEEHKIEVGDDE